MFSQAVDSRFLLQLFSGARNFLRLRYATELTRLAPKSEEPAALARSNVGPVVASNNVAEAAGCIAVRERAVARALPEPHTQAVVDDLAVKPAAQQNLILAFVSLNCLPLPPHSLDLAAPRDDCSNTRAPQDQTQLFHLPVQPVRNVARAPAQLERLLLLRLFPARWECAARI